MMNTPGLVLVFCLTVAPQQADELVDKLRSDRSDEREAAERRLFELGRQAVPALKRGAGDPDPEVSSRARHLLKKIDLAATLSPALLKTFPHALGQLAAGDDVAITALFLEANIWEDPGRRRRHRELKKRDLLPLLEPALRGARSPEHRILLAALAGGESRLEDDTRTRSPYGPYPTAVPALLRFLEDEGEDVRSTVLIALDSLHRVQPIPPSAVPALVRCMEDPSAAAEAIEALGEFRFAEAAPAIARRLEDENQGVARSAACALGKLGARDQIPALRKLLKKGGGPGGSAAVALASMGDAESVPAFAGLLGDTDPDARTAGLYGLRRLKARQFLPQVKELLQDPTSYVVLAAVAAAGDLGDRTVLPDLRPLLERQDDLVREEVVKTMGRLGAVRDLVPLLGDKSPQIKYYAESALRSLRGAARAETRAMVADLESSVRLLALQALILLEGRDDQGDFSRLLKDPDPAIREKAAGRASSIDALLEALADPHPGVRGAAARTLAARQIKSASSRIAELLKKGDEPALLDCLVDLDAVDACPRIAPLLDHEDADVRLSAARALARLGAAEKGAPILRGFLASPKPAQAIAAAAALVRAGYPDAKPLLVRLLKTLEGLDEELCIDGVEALEAVGAVPELLDLLDTTEGWVNVGAILALGDMGARECIPRLIDLLESDFWGTSRYALWTLAELQAVEAIPAITEHLNGSHLLEKPDVLEALARIGGASHAPRILPFLDHADLEVRRAAAEAVGTMGLREAVPALTRLLEDPEARVRAGAAKALVELGIRKGVPVLIEEADWDATVSLAILNELRAPEESRRLRGVQLRGRLQGRLSRVVEEWARETGLTVRGTPPGATVFVPATDSWRRICALLGERGMDPILDPGTLRLLPRQETLEFWRAWLKGGK